MSVKELTIKREHILKYLKEIEKNNLISEITFSSVIGSLFPLSYNMLRNDLREEHFKGYLDCVNQIEYESNFLTKIENDVVNNIKVYDMAESIYASGYPMKTEILAEEKYARKIAEIKTDLINKNYDNADIKRAIKLSMAKGAGHNQFLTGILVSFDLTVSNKAWIEVERYKFLYFVSSQSTMHKIASFNLEEACDKEVDKEIIAIVNKKIEQYKANPTTENYIKILKNLPSGLKLTARITTNYRCLKNVIQQREDHILPDWTKAVEVFKKLPLMEELL